MTVRAATEADQQTIQRLLTDMHQESVYRHVHLEHEKLTAFLKFVRDDERHALLVYENADGEIDGVYIGNIGNYFFSNELGAWDLIFYVRPERRGSLCAARLWRAFRQWAEAKGAKAIWPGISTGVYREQAARFYRGMGLEEVGSVFFQRLPVKQSR